jgi:hypothetical protein
MPRKILLALFVGFLAYWMALELIYGITRTGVLHYSYAPHVTTLRHCLNPLSQHAREFTAEKGHVPESMNQLIEYVWGKHKITRNFWRDKWGTDIEYEIINEKFRFVSYGQDKKPGGVGVDADLYSDEKLSEKHEPTFWQFLTYKNFMLQRMACLCSGLFALVVSIIAMIKDSIEKKKAGSVETFFAIALAVAFSLGFGLLMVAFSYPSGH